MSNYRFELLKKEVRYLKRFKSSISNEIKENETLTRVRQAKQLIDSSERLKIAHSELIECIRLFLLVSEKLEENKEIRLLRRNLHDILTIQNQYI